jgi:hypothetical protein
VRIFEPRDWVYFQALLSWARVETYQKLVYGENKGSKTYKKSYLDMVRFRTQSQHFQATDQKFWPYSWVFSSLGAEMWKKIGNRRRDEQRNDFNRAQFLKMCYKVLI